MSVTEEYPGDPGVRYEYEVTRVARLLDDDKKAEADGYDKMLVMLRRVGMEATVIKPMYWAMNRKGNWSYGQYPAALEPEEWRTLFKELGQPWVR